MFVGANVDRESDVIVSWLPCFHDMGMTGYLTVPMYFGVELIKITPMDFLRDTLLWAKLIDKYKGTMTAAPAAWMIRPATSTHRTGASAHATKCFLAASPIPSRIIRPGRPSRVNSSTGPCPSAHRPKGRTPKRNHRDADERMFPVHLSRPVHLDVEFLTHEKRLRCGDHIPRRRR